MTEYLGGLKRTNRLPEPVRYAPLSLLIALCAAVLPKGSVHASDDALLLAVPAQAPDQQIPEGWWCRPSDLRIDAPPHWPGTELWYVRVSSGRRAFPLGRYSDPLTGSGPAVGAPARWYVTQWRQDEGQIELLEISPMEAERGHTRVVVAVPVQARQSAVSFLMSRTAASPDGRFVACPTPEPSVVLIDTASGNPLGRYADAFDPAWDRNGRRLLVRSERQIRGMLLIRTEAPEAPSTIPGEVACQPARFSGKDNWFWQLQWHKRPARKGGFEVTPVLVRYHPSGGVRIVNTLWPLRLPIDSARRSVFLLDPPSDTHAVVLVRDQDGTGEIWEWQATSTAPLRRLAELPVPLTPRAPEWTPDGQRILWIGPAPGVPALLNRASFDLVPLLRSPVSQTYLLSGAVFSSVELMRTCADRFPDPICTVLQWPAPWQIEQVRDVRGVPPPFQQARRVARYTLRLARAWNAHPGSAPRRFDLEARLWLSYLAGDFEQTLRTAELLEPLLHEKQNREALILVRLYALIGAGQWTEAANMLDALARLPGEWENGPEMEKALQTIGQIVDRMRHNSPEE